MTKPFIMFSCTEVADIKKRTACEPLTLGSLGVNNKCVVLWTR